MKKLILALMLAGITTVAQADSTTSIVDALVKKGVLTPEEAADVVKEAKNEKKEIVKNSQPAGDELPIKFYGTIRTFLEHDKINTPGAQPDARVSNWISRLGIRFKEPITAFGDGWVINGQYETSFQSDNPKYQTTYLGDMQSTIGLASNYVDSAAEYKLDIGRKPHGLWLTIREFGIFNDDPGSPMGEIHARQNIFMSNGIYAQYKPSYVPGLTINTDYSLSERDNVRNKYSVSTRYNWDRYSIVGVRYDDYVGNETNLIAGSIEFKELKSKLTAIYSDDKQTGTPLPTNGLTLKTKGFSTQWAWKYSENNTALIGYGHRNDGVDAYTLGNDYQLNKRTTLQLHYQHTTADNPIVFTTANDIGPIYGTNGGAAAATATSRDLAILGLKFVF
jgi:polyhydroxyalkanoate synthesis regulator phasin